MTKSAAKLPTIQDLTREELLRLIPMIHPLPVEAARILAAQEEQAWADYGRAADAYHAASLARSAAWDRWHELNIAEKPGATKARRAYDAAADAASAAHRRDQRLYNRWLRLSGQCRALTDREA